MDLKSKSWAGSIYHKFEAICQEVDDFVSKDTMKFVENQVQSVGVSVKRLYSDVVREILPPLGENIKPESHQSLSGEHVQINDHVKSETGIIAKPNCVVEKEMPVDQDSVDTVNKRNTVRSSELDYVRHCTDPHCTIPSQETRTDLSSKQDGDAKVSNDSDKSIEENNAYCFSNISSIGWLSESESPLVQESNSKEHRSLLPEASADKFHEDNTLAIDSSSSLACDEALKASGKDGILYDNFSTKDESVMVSTSVQSSEHGFSNEEAEMCVIPSSCLTSLESSNLLSARYPVISILESNGNSNTGVGIGDLNMETIDLSADVRLNELNCKFVHASYHRRRNFRYYKKLIHDAFASRKRLSKEYEQLPILYGGIDMKFKQHFQPNSLPSLPTTPGHTEKSLSDQKGCDYEWELI